MGCRVDPGGTRQGRGPLSYATSRGTGVSPFNTFLVSFSDEPINIFDPFRLVSLVKILLSFRLVSLVDGIFNVQRNSLINSKSSEF